MLYLNTQPLFYFDEVQKNYCCCCCCRFTLEDMECVKLLDLPQVDCDNAKASESQDDGSEGRSPETSDEVPSRLVSPAEY